MQLRASSEEANVSVAVGGGSDDDGVVAGGAIRGFVGDILGGDEAAIAATRGAVVHTLGPEPAAFVVGVGAFFDAINRLADGVGIKLDEGTDIPVELDLSSMAGATRV